MSVRNLLTINAILVALVSLTALLFPTVFLNTNGLEITQYTINLMRAFGAISTGYAVMSWLLRSQPASAAQRAFLLGAGVSYLLFAAVNVINITALPGLETIIGWVYFWLNLLLGISFFYFAIKKPVVSPA